MASFPNSPLGGKKKSTVLAIRRRREENVRTIFLFAVVDKNKLGRFAIHRRLLLFFRHFLLFVVAEIKLNSAFRYSSLFIGWHVTLAPFGIRRLNKTINGAYCTSCSCLRECKCAQLVSSPRHPKAWYTPFRGFGGVLRTLLLGFRTYYIIMRPFFAFNLGKKAASYRGAYRVPLFSLSVCACV